MHSLTSALDGGECSASRPDRFTPQRRSPGTSWVGPRAGLDVVSKRKILNPDRLARSHSLYRLSYPGSD